MKMKNNKIKRVLSIDMDLIGWQSIALYNNLVGESGAREEAFWAELEESLHINQFIKCDEKALGFINDLFKKVIKKVDKENIFFVKDHDMILELLCGDANKADEILEVYNIDHHHDIYYGERQKEFVDRFDFTTLGCWLYYLGVHDKVEKYYWIKSPYSGDFPVSQLSDLDFPVQSDEFDKLPYDIFAMDFDYVCVCKSPDYLPIMLWDEFYKLIDIANTEKKTTYTVWQEDYCKGGKTRHIMQR